MIGGPDSHNTREWIAELHLGARFEQDAPGVGQGVRAVAHASWLFRHYEGREHMLGDWPRPDEGDVAAALRLIVKYRRTVEDDERELIGAARALGVEWQDIGLALGYPEKSARQSAAARARRLGIPAERVQQPRRGWRERTGRGAS